MDIATIVGMFGALGIIVAAILSGGGANVLTCLDMADDLAFVFATAGEHLVRFMMCVATAATSASYLGRIAWPMPLANETRRGCSLEVVEPTIPYKTKQNSAFGGRGTRSAVCP